MGVEKIISELNELKGVKAVEKRDKILKVKLFSKPIKGTELFRIPGDLRNTSQKIRAILEESRKNEGYNWEWISKPKKKYRDRSLKNSAVSDREPKGYSQRHYEISLIESK